MPEAAVRSDEYFGALLQTVGVLTLFIISAATSSFEAGRIRNIIEEIRKAVQVQSAKGKATPTPIYECGFTLTF